jgi:hypothetical protein
MNFFSILNKLIFNKNKSSIEAQQEGIEEFVPFLVNRWVSFYDTSAAVFINETFNKFHSIPNDKVEGFNLYYNLLPSFRYKKINYIKKNKEGKENSQKDEAVLIEAFATNHKISKREVQLYLDLIK